MPPQAEQGNKSSTLTFILVGFVIGVVITVLIFFAFGGRQNLDQFDLIVNEKSINVQMKAKRLDYESVLDTLFIKPFAKAGTIGWLKTNQKIYPFEDADLIDAIAKLKPKDNYSKKFQELQINHKGPFQFTADSVTFGVPSTGPPEGIAFVDFNSNYRGRHIYLQNYALDRHITIECKPGYACPGSGSCVDFQLNPKDAQNLLGDNIFLKKNPVLATIIDNI